MKDLQLYQELLGLRAPWQVSDVKMDLPAQEITVTVACAEGEVWACPACSHRMHVQGWEERAWRHLDTCRCRTLLTARVPRLRCSHPQCPDGRTGSRPCPGPRDTAAAPGTSSAWPSPCCWNVPSAEPARSCA